VAVLTAAAPAGAQPAAQGAAGLSTVRIPQPVFANGKPLAPGTYDIRITEERPALPSGVPSDSQRWVEFLRGGDVVAREVAEIIPAEGSQAAATADAAPRTLVQLLKEGDFVRVSIWRSGLRYLVYLPTEKPPAGAPPAQ
jgi:hypothetical protein